MFATIIFTLSWFNYESPRFLVKTGKDTDAIQNLSRIRNLPTDHDVIVREIADIKNQLAEEQAATEEQGWKGIIKEMFCIPSNLYRIYLGIAVQLLTQWCGAQSITVYAPDFFLLVGVSGQNEKLFATAILGVVKLVGAVICAFFLVDVIGRKRSLTIGITIQSTAMMYIAIFLTVIGTPNPKSFSPSTKSASIGAIVMIYIASFGWALGWNGIQYLLNAEIYPLRIRAMSSSLIMLLHFVNQYGANRAVPEMLLPTNQAGLGPAGSFWFFVGITVFSGFWAWFFIPETSGHSLESMDRLFRLRWYQIGRYGQRYAEASQDVLDEKVRAAGKNKTIEHAETV